MKKLRRGQRFRKATTDAASPIHMIAISVWELEKNQKSEGAYQ
jgi:hypothetical protein